MPSEMNADVKIELYGIEVDEETIHRFMAKDLTEEEIIAIVYDGISGNRAELIITSAKVNLA